jgi:hypothetical protein
MIGSIHLAKRETSFSSGGWSHRRHIAGTPIADAPVLRPIDRPVWRHRLTSGRADQVRLDDMSAAAPNEITAAFTAFCTRLGRRSSASENWLSCDSTSDDTAHISMRISVEPSGTHVGIWLTP